VRAAKANWKGLCPRVKLTEAAWAPSSLAMSSSSAHGRGGGGGNLSAEKVRQHFEDGLGQLTFNSKVQINFLTMLADDSKDFAEEVVAAIESRIMANPGAGLPVLYLTDSICKNIGGVYIALFSELLADVVGRLLSELDPPSCKKVLHVRNHWDKTFSSMVLRDVDARIQNHMAAVNKPSRKRRNVQSSRAAPLEPGPVRPYGQGRGWNPPAVGGVEARDWHHGASPSRRPNEEAMHALRQAEDALARGGLSPGRREKLVQVVTRLRREIHGPEAPLGPYRNNHDTQRPFPQPPAGDPRLRAAEWAPDTRQQAAQQHGQFRQPYMANEAPPHDHYGGRELRGGHDAYPPRRSAGGAHHAPHPPGNEMSNSPQRMPPHGAGGIGVQAPHHGDFHARQRHAGPQEASQARTEPARTADPSLQLLESLMGSIQQAGILPDVSGSALPSNPCAEVAFTVESLKARHAGVISALYEQRPHQCQQCGIRFAQSSKQDLHDHLDWHFRATKEKKKSGVKVSAVVSSGGSVA